MSSNNPLSNLKDIHLPPEVSIWPPAIGWWFLFGLIVLLLILSSFLQWNRYKFKRPKNEALKILKDIQNNYDITNDDLVTLVNLSKLIRRTALTYYGKKGVAPLHGIAWLEFLDETGQTNEFSKGKGMIFGKGIYSPDPKIDVKSLFPIVKKWMSLSIKYKDCNKY